VNNATFNETSSRQAALTKDLRSIDSKSVSNIGANRDSDYNNPPKSCSGLAVD